MDEGTPLGGLESEDDAKPSHGLHAVFSSLRGRGYLAHRLRIRFPEDKGVRRPLLSARTAMRTLFSPVVVAKGSAEKRWVHRSQWGSIPKNPSQTAAKMAACTMELGLRLCSSTP
jgi:hypothetical protein